MLAIQNVTKQFDGFTAVRDIDFQVKANSIYGLVGYNGAGKTTLLKTIAGVYRPEQGTVLLDGEKVYDSPRAKQRIFYVPDDLYFQPYASMDKMAAFYRGYYPQFSMKTFRNVAGVFGLETGKRILGFSKGMQRQAELTLALAARPNVLLFDESFDGLDPSVRSLVERLLREYLSEREITVVISSHNLHELAGLCDHVGLINGKRLVMNCAVDEVGRTHFRVTAQFDAAVPESLLDGLDYRELKREGNQLLFLARGEKEAIERHFAPLGVRRLELLPMTLEEVFLNEMEDKAHDLSSVFA